MRKVRCLSAALLVIVSVLITSLSPGTVFALVQGDVAAWQTSVNTLPAVVRASGSTVYDDYVYVAGGDGSDGPTNAVSYAHLNSDGTTGSWQSTTVLPDSFMEPTVAAYDGYLYVMGGYGGSPSVRATIYYAQIDADDGSLGSWTTSSTALPYASHAANSVVHDGFLYYMGGVNFGTTYATVSYAAINNDGSIGSWTSTTSMPDSRRRASAFVANDRVYVLGGQNSGNDIQSAVMYADLNSNGTVGSWTVSDNSLPQQRLAGGAAYIDGFAYYLAGHSGSATSSTVYYAKVNSDGTTGTWSAATNSLPIAMDATMAVTNGTYLYVIGGANSNGDKLDTVYYAQVTPYNANGDDDSDGVNNGVEDAAPNSGDANNDGTPDAQQSNVASFVSPVTEKYVTLTNGGDGPECDITSVSISAEDENEQNDSGYDYGLGMVDFTAQCENEGDSVTVTILFHDETLDENYQLRKYNPTTGLYAEIADPYVDYFEWNESDSGFFVSYVVQDGGELDVDGLTNAVIEDPVGVALAATQSSGNSNSDSSGSATVGSDNLASTGQSARFYSMVAGTLILAGASFVLVCRKALLKS